MTIDLSLLSKPFGVADLEYRIGTLNKAGTSGMALTYVTNRAIMDRLDSVVGPERWQNTFEASPLGNGLLCGIGVEVSTGNWVWKYDGAQETKTEAVKGGLSGAMKRAAVQWGIGRYLYSLPATWVDLREGRRPANAVYAGKGKWFIPPPLPKWAVPDGAPVIQTAGFVQPSPPTSNGSGQINRADALDAAQEWLSYRGITLAMVQELAQENDWKNPEGWGPRYWERFQSQLLKGTWPQLYAPEAMGAS